MFGIIESIFTIFRREMIANVDKVVNVTKASVALHNFLMKTSNTNSDGSCPSNTDEPSGQKPMDL